MSQEPDFPPEAQLSALEADFVKAMELREKGRGEEARAHLEGILKVEPRLPEPHMEMARLLMEAERLEDAEAEAREAIALLEKGGQWLDDVPENVVCSLAWALLGEILKQQASTDEVVFGPADRFHAYLTASKAAFTRAAELDPEDLASAINAEELGDTEESEDMDA